MRRRAIKKIFTIILLFFFLCSDSIRLHFSKNNFYPKRTISDFHVHLAHRALSLHGGGLMELCLLQELLPRKEICLK